jgi:hypothetical protein
LRACCSWVKHANKSSRSSFNWQQRSLYLQERNETEIPMKTMQHYSIMEASSFALLSRSALFL